jgi:hypothetical protein
VGSATRGLWRSPALYRRWRPRRVRIARQPGRRRASRSDAAENWAPARSGRWAAEAENRGATRKRGPPPYRRTDDCVVASGLAAELPDLSPYRGPEPRGGEHRATPLVMRVRTAKPDPTATGRRRHESAPGQGRIGVASHQPSRKRQCGRGLRQRDRTPCRVPPQQSVPASVGSPAVQDQGPRPADRRSSSMDGSSGRALRRMGFCNRGHARSFSIFKAVSTPRARS